MTQAREIAWTRAAKRSRQRLPEKVATAVAEFIDGALAENRARVGNGLRFELEGLHSARRGDYRVIYRIEGLQITIVAIEHRADAYR